MGKVIKRTRLSSELLNADLIQELKNHSYGIKFIHFVNGDKPPKNSLLNYEEYESSIILDDMSDVFFKYYKDKELLRFIFYINTTYPEKSRDPIYAFDVKMSISDYLDLMETIIHCV